MKPEIDLTAIYEALAAFSVPEGVSFVLLVSILVAVPLWALAVHQADVRSKDRRNQPASIPVDRL